MTGNSARLASSFLPCLLLACFPGGLIDKGGYADHPLILASATLTRGAPYHVLCWDEVEAERRKRAAEQEAEKEAPPPDGKAESKSGGGKTAGGESGLVQGPPVRMVAPADYRGGCEQEGEHSVFFLFNVFPVTPVLSPEYAISTAVQRLEGDTMVKIRAWHEVHYYSLLGRVSVFKVRGDVIRFDVAAPEAKAKENGRPKGGKR